MVTVESCCCDARQRRYNIQYIYKFTGGRGDRLDRGETLARRCQGFARGPNVASRTVDQLIQAIQGLLVLRHF